MCNGLNRALGIALLLAAGGAGLVPAFARDKPRDICQGMSGARNGVQYCQTPLQALLANSGDYDGRHVAAFGYLLHEGGSSDALGPSADALRRIDFIGCVAVDLSGAEYEDSVRGIEQGLYFVMVQGVYHAGAVNGACVGELRAPFISRISKVDEVD
ncbi:TPA: hypothetical protein QDZ75_004086 [Stenotrophomonas maltophilia]|uniref:hypothetical protein n=1 Tax=Stenotrophomonas TaxID=40323 RepID=UPI0012FD3F0D|nr:MULTISPECIES: hypothetical protein [Stenotrophomonas]HDS1140011.1 hypothetical protein [Stenotrophomonas maltophilia]HDS1147240.1 hypothetical protein [Stenotrophomonas maltophilia]HDS1163384.1 hypothetical protein [Stenotrophomonas maltophilia]HEL5401970.1 hypothetical protein [Stenotrophomonas maltophilia]